jgi:DNA-binding transcriptional MerR regulator
MREAHLPLAKIKAHLQAVEGEPAEAITERLLPKLVEFFSLDGEEPELGIEAIAESAGLAYDQLARLQELGVLRPTMADGRPVFTQADADAAAAARLLLDQGVDIEDLRFVRRYAELIEQEHAFILHHLIRPALDAGRRDKVSAGRGFQALRVIEAYLRRQFRREHGIFGEPLDVLPDPLRDQNQPPNTEHG